MRTYRASGIAPMPGIMRLAVFAVVGGLFIGGAFGLVSHFFDLLIIFPLLMGLAGGAAVASAISTGKVRNVLVAIFFSLLIGVITYGSTHYVDYIFFQHEVRTELLDKVAPEKAGAADTFVNAFTDMMLEKETGSTGFPGYMKLVAKNGVKIGHAGSDMSSKKPMLTGVGVWILWAVELLLCLGAGLALAIPAANKPFCENCEAWYQDEVLARYATDTQSTALLAALNNGDFSAASALLSTIDVTDIPRLELYLQHCPRCQSNYTMLILKRLTMNKKNETNRSELVTGLITPAEETDLLAVEAKPPTETMDTTETFA